MVENTNWRTIKWTHDKLKPATAKRWMSRMDDELRGIVGYDTREQPCPRVPTGSTQEIKASIEEKIAAWKARDRSVVSSLRSAIDDEYYDQFIGEYTAAELWAKVKTAFLRESKAEQSAIEDQIDSSDPRHVPANSEYFGAVDLPAFMAKLSGLRQDLINAGGELSEGKLCDKALRRIVVCCPAWSENYELKTLQEKSKTVDLTIDQVTNILKTTSLVRQRTADTQAAMRAATGEIIESLEPAFISHVAKERKAKQGMECFWCGRQGHFEDACLHKDGWLKRNKITWGTLKKVIPTFQNVPSF